MGYNANEIVEFAINIETEGEKFYRKLSTNLNNDEVKELFKYFADQEVVHKETFSKMLDEIADYKPAENYPEEYFVYLKTLSENIVFSAKKFEEVIDNLDNSIAAVEFAIRRELDSILYYYEMRELVSDSQKDTINRIILEEKEHFRKFSDIRDALLKR